MANETYKLKIGGTEYPIYSEGVKLIGSNGNNYYPLIFSSSIGSSTNGNSSYQKLYTDIQAASNISSSAIGYNPSTNTLKLSALAVPTTSNGTTYGLGTSGQVLKTNGNSVYWSNETDSDTKNTAGSTDSSSKLFLIGATSQAANPQTYSHDTAYVGADGYLYSNSEKVNMRLTTSLIPAGTSIPANVDLNVPDYFKVGKYYCSKTADAKTLQNCPVAAAFSMEVYNPLSTTIDNETTGTWVYRLRKITEYNTGVQYIQYAYVGATANQWTYNNWFIIPRASFTLDTTDNNGGSAALGSSTQGVYLDSTGTFKKMTYSLNKTVPSTAVFTDSIVSEVGNHYTPTENSGSALSASGGALTDIANSSSGVQVVTGLKRDAAGHVVGVNSVALKATNNTYTIPTALKNPKSLKAGNKSYDGSSEVTLTAADFGLGQAMRYIGKTTTSLSDGSTTNPITIDSVSTTVQSGDVVIDKNEQLEYIWNGSKWESFGNEGAYKVIQTAVSDPTASGSSSSFIDTISQDTNGKITVTKKNIPSINNGTFSIKTLVSSTSTTVSDFTANQSGNDDVTFVQGSNITITPDATNRKITIAAYNTDTKVTNTLKTDTKYYLTGTTSSTTNTGTQIFDTGVYVDTTAGKLVASSFSGPLIGDVTGNCSGSAGSVAWSGVTGKPVALSQFTNDLGLGSLAYKNSLESSDIPSHSHSYLSTGGGTLSGTLTVNATPGLIVYRSSGVPYIRFAQNSSTIYGEFGANSSGAPQWWTDAAGKWLTMLHENNFDSYAAKKSHTHASSDVSGLSTVATSGSYNDLSNKPTIPSAASNGTYSIKTLVGSTSTIVSDFTANQSSADDVTFVQGSNITITPDATNRKITIAATNTNDSVTSVDKHYSPSANAASELTGTLSGTAGSYAKDTEYTVLTGVKAQRDAKGHITGLTYTAQKIKDTNTTYTIPTVNNGTYSIKTLVGSTSTTVSDFTANQSSADDVTFVQGSNITITPDATNRKITIAATNTNDSVTSVDKHYSPSANTGSALSASGGTLTDIANSSSGVQVVTGLKRDAKGHVVGVNSVALKATNTVTSLDNCVLITGDQTIAGVKTFTNEVIGTKFSSSDGFFDTSDETLKNFGERIEVDFEKLKALKKNYFTWKDGDGSLQIGVSAQEIKEIYPEIVNTDENGKLSVAYDKLSVIALTAIDKLYDKLNSLEEKLDIVLTSLSKS